MEKERKVEEVYQSIEKVGLMQTIKIMFGAGTQIRIPFSQEVGAMSIENLGLSVRSFNALKREGIDTIKKVLIAINENRLENIRNLGKKSVAEICVSMYKYGYQNLSKAERIEFVKNLIELNGEKRL